MPDAPETATAHPPDRHQLPTLQPRLAGLLSDLRAQRGPVPYLVAGLCLGASLVVAALLRKEASVDELLMMHVMTTVLIAAWMKPSVALLGALLGGVAFDYLVIPPPFSISASWHQTMTLLSVLLVTLIVSTLHHRLRRHERIAVEAAHRSRALYELSVRLASATEPDQIARLALTTVADTLGAEVAFRWLPAAESLDVWQSGAQRALEERRVIAASELPQTYWAPLWCSSKAYGVVRATLPRYPHLETDPNPFLTAVASQVAMSLERLEISAAARKSELEAAGERARSTFLSGFSHDLKTPLTTILAAATTLLGHGDRIDSTERQQLLQSIVTESERMGRLIRNVLSFSRLSAPGVGLQRTSESIEEILAVCLDRMHAVIQDVKVELPVDKVLPLVRVDPLLIEQVLVNLLENAARYALPKPAVYIRVVTQKDSLKVIVGDNGPGIPEDEREQVFRKFYRGRTAKPRDGGLGLGLTICEAAMAAHGTHLKVGTSDWGGAAFEFTLPLDEALYKASPSGENQLTTAEQL